jgi:hypothetical protein
MNITINQVESNVTTIAVATCLSFLFLLIVLSVVIFIICYLKTTKTYCFKLKETLDDKNTNDFKGDIINPEDMINNKRDTDEITQSSETSSEDKIGCVVHITELPDIYQIEPKFVQIMKENAQEANSSIHSVSSFSDIFVYENEFSQFTILQQQQQQSNSDSTRL